MRDINFHNHPPPENFYHLSSLKSSILWILLRKDTGDTLIYRKKLEDDGTVAKALRQQQDDITII